MKEAQLKRLNEVITKFDKTQKFMGDLQRQLSGAEIRISKDGAEVMKCHLDPFVNGTVKDGTVVPAKALAKPSEDDLKKVNEAVRLMFNIVVNRELVNITKDRARTIAWLATAWNTEIAKMPQAEFENNAKAIIRMVAGTETLQDLVTEGRALVNMMRGFRNYQPISFDLARHYLETFKKGESDECCRD